MYKRRGGVSGKCGKWDWDVNVGYEGVEWGVREWRGREWGRGVRVGMRE